jgi:hypothetical protein
MLALLALSSSPVALVVPAWACRLPMASPRIVMAADDGQSGKGFGPSSDSGAEERGRAILEEMRKQSSESKGSVSAPPVQADVPALGTEGSPVLGIAGFLIFAGVLSLFVGGPLWQAKGFNDDGSQPANTPSGTAPEAVPFGFAPKAPTTS